MKLYVEEQDMPPNCAECDAEGHYDNSYGDEYGFFCPFGYKAYTSETRELKRLDNCPLVPVPPHGDLIDRSQLCDDSIGGDYGSGTRVYYAYEVEHAPVIIPSSRQARRAEYERQRKPSRPLHIGWY